MSKPSSLNQTERSAKAMGQRISLQPEKPEFVSSQRTSGYTPADTSFGPKESTHSSVASNIPRLDKLSKCAFC